MLRDPLGLVPVDIKARYAREEFVDRAAHAGRALDAALKQEDPALSCVFVRPGISEDDLPPGAVPGRWHVRRTNDPPAMPHYIPIQTPSGGYREPDSGVLNELRERDLRRPGRMEAMLERSRTDTAKKGKQLETEQRRDELLLDLRAGKRVAGEGGLRKRTWAKGKVSA